MSNTLGTLDAFIQKTKGHFRDVDMEPKDFLYVEQILRDLFKNLKTCENHCKPE